MHCLTRIDDVIVNTHCDVTMGRGCCLGSNMMSQWVDNVGMDTKQSRDQTLNNILKTS